jgi:hypothetical protein
VTSDASGARDAPGAPGAAGTQITFGRIDRALPRLDEELPGVIRRLGVASLVLVDAAAVGKTVNALGLEPGAFTRAQVPVLALDCWDLPKTPWVWDYGSHTEILHPEFHGLERRLVPVPIGRPDVAGGYSAVPQLAPLPTAARRDLRADLGLGDADRLVLWPTAPWQHGESHAHPFLAELARALPRLVLPRLEKLGARVKVLHVGPMRFADAASPAYHHISQVEPARFERLVAAADLLLGFNAIATSLATALAARTPILLGTSTLVATTIADADEALGARQTPAVRAFIAAALALGPLRPLRAWPLSLDGVLGPALADNPFYSAVRVVDALDEAAFVDACRELLFDEAARAALRGRQEAYADRVHPLPSGPERFLSLLRG